MVDSVQVFGRKKTSVAVAYCKRGRGLIKVNGQPVEFLQPELLRLKLLEPMLVLGAQRFQLVDIRVRVQGGGYTSQIYGQNNSNTAQPQHSLPHSNAPTPSTPTGWRRCIGWRSEWGGCEGERVDWFAAAVVASSMG